MVNCKTIKAITMAVALATAISCSKETPVPDIPDLENMSRAQVISVQFNVKMTADQVKEAIGDEQLNERVKYGISCYKIRYKTMYMKEAIPADALLIVPEMEPGTPMRFASYLHGTILPLQVPALDTNCPSDYKGASTSKDILYCALPLAASGYCVVTPDYTGYGPTSGRDHPFICYPELSKSTLDGIRAARRVLEDNLDIDLYPQGFYVKDIWLTGWSQGAGNALYIQRELESLDGSSLNVRGTSTLAGPYNLLHFIKDMMDNPDKLYPAIALYSWAAYTLNKFTPGLQRPGDQIFRMRIYDQASSFLVLSSTARELFQDFFMKYVQDGTDTKFIKAMDDASTAYGWTPAAPIYMHHGTKDALVPYFNMTDAYEGLKDSGNVFTYTEEGGGHSDFVPKYMSHTIDWFKELQEGDR